MAAAITDAASVQLADAAATRDISAMITILAILPALLGAAVEVLAKNQGNAPLLAQLAATLGLVPPEDIYARMRAGAVPAIVIPAQTGTAVHTAAAVKGSAISAVNAAGSPSTLALENPAHLKLVAGHYSAQPAVTAGQYSTQPAVTAGHYSTQPAVTAGHYSTQPAVTAGYYSAQPAGSAASSQSCAPPSSVGRSKSLNDDHGADRSKPARPAVGDVGAVTTTED